MLKLTPARDSVARYSLTGMVTRPNWMAPFHMERATDLPHARRSVLAPSGTRLYHPLATAPAISDVVLRCGSRSVPDRLERRGWRRRALASDALRVGARHACIAVELGSDLVDRAHAALGDRLRPDPARGIPANQTGNDCTDDRPQVAGQARHREHATSGNPTGEEPEDGCKVSLVHTHKVRARPAPRERPIRTPPRSRM